MPLEGSYFISVPQGVPWFKGPSALLPVNVLLVLLVLLGFTVHLEPGRPRFSKNQ